MGSEMCIRDRVSSRERDGRSVGEIRRRLQEAAMGVSGEGEKSLSLDPEKQ